MYVANLTIQTSALSGVMNIYDGHLCKGDPLIAANFGLQTNAQKSEFHGNVSVVLQFSDTLSEGKEVDIRIPPLILHVRQKHIAIYLFSFCPVELILIHQHIRFYIHGVQYVVF